MEEFLSLFTFGIGAFCFVVFFATLTPATITAAVGPGKFGQCSTKASATIACRPHLFAAALGPAVGQQ